MYNDLNVYLILSAALFSIGIFGVLMRRSLIGVLIATELILNAANINFLAFSRFMDVDKALGSIYSIFVIGLAAGEVAVGLSIILTIYRKFKTINIEKMNQLKG